MVPIGCGRGDSPSTPDSNGLPVRETPGLDGSADASTPASNPNADPYIDKVVLLMHMTGAAGSATFSDSTGRHPDATVVGQPSYSSKQAVFGTTSLYLDGSSYLSLPASVDWDMTEADATVEAWIYPMPYTGCGAPTPGQCEQGIVGQGPGIGDGHWLFFLLNENPYGLYAGLSGSDVHSVYSGLPAIASIWNQWNHVALSKTGDTTSLYVNGKQVASATVNPFDGAAQALVIGATATTALGTGMAFHGYMDDLRITKGVGRYSANFAPPTAPFPDPPSRRTPPVLPVATWTSFSQNSPPPTHGYSSLVWTGSNLILWGGQIPAPMPGGVITNQGWKYDPVTQNWSTISTDGAPALRYAHTAVWTGTKMIVWGGADQNNGEHDGPTKNDGGIYDPATDKWTPMSAVGAPAARMLHTAVWTGQTMIVWGGTPGPRDLAPTPFNDGAVYDPMKDTWAPLSQTNPPSVRQGHAAAWTGSQMIVWGGQDPQGYVMDGALLDPSSGQWTAIVNGAAPPPGKYALQGTWSGTEFLVWGGVEGNPGQASADGWAYNPSTETWRSLPSNGQPSGRYAYGAAWDGNQWYVWGGIDPGISAFNGGGSFFP
jgi:N-acetylneuraminic acid mutarotase